MRPDAKALLSRLGQRDFQYRQFADPIADVEPWPLFAALLEDERVVGRAERANEERASAANFLSDYDDMSGRGDPRCLVPASGGSDRR